MFWGGYEHGPAHVSQTDPARPPRVSSAGELGPNACFLVLVIHFIPLLFFVPYIEVSFITFIICIDMAMHAFTFVFDLFRFCKFTAVCGACTGWTPPSIINE